MSFDIAYHIFDQKLLEEKIIPFLMGDPIPIEPLIKNFSKIRVNRFIANAYANKISKLKDDFIEKANAEKSIKLLQKLKMLLLRQPLNSLNREDEAILNELMIKFESFWIIWGRPFFITEQDNKRIVEVIDKYLAANENELHAIIRTQMDNIHPSLYKYISVTEEDLEECFSLAELEDIFMSDILQLKGIFDAALNNRLFIGSDGKEHNALDLLKTPFLLIDFLALGVPAWMDRGLINPSELITNAGIEMPAYVKPSSYLLTKFTDKLKIEESEIQFSENFCLGMVVFPENINEFNKFFQEKINYFYDYLKREDFTSEAADLVLKKITEALMYACEKNYIFVESTDIFSGIRGIVT